MMVSMKEVECIAELFLLADYFLGEPVLDKAGSRKRWDMETTRIVETEVDEQRLRWNYDDGDEVTFIEGQFTEEGETRGVEQLRER